MNEISIYVHIPFCESKCHYCDFNSGKYSSDIQEEYFNALKNEIIQNKIKNKIKSIYFGGGTPSSVSEKNIAKILELIKNNFDVKKDAEITIECNPNSLSENKLKTYYSAGFNRISLGVQTTNKKSLKIIGRIQDKNKLKSYKKIIKNNLKLAKKIGFNISADLMLGLPKNNNFNLIKDILFLNKYTRHISVYMLTLYSGTKLFETLKSEDIENTTIKQYKLTCKLLNLLRFEQYEISNFAKSNCYSKHNLNYWSCGEYLGFGLSAHSYLNGFRYSNSENMKKYLESFKYLKFDIKVKSNQQIIDQCKMLNLTMEQLTNKDKAEEFLMLSLRLNRGLDIKSFSDQFYNILEEKAEIIEELKNRKLIKIDDGKLKLTKNGKLFENQVALRLI